MHKISNVSAPDGIWGECSKCGFVAIRSYNINGTGRKRYRCINAYRESQRKRKRHAGLNADERVEMIMANPHCEICGTGLTVETAKIDHDHSDGHVRGVLCNDHNIALGLFRDDIELLKSAIKYLRSSKVQ